MDIDGIDERRGEMSWMFQRKELTSAKVGGWGRHVRSCILRPTTTNVNPSRLTTQHIKLLWQSSGTILSTPLTFRIVIMASKGPLARCLSRAKPSVPRVPRRYQPFSISHRTQTDGVFRALTNERVEVPWVEAFRRQQTQGKEPQQESGTPQTPADRDLSPRTMSDSYHSVVCIVNIRLRQLTD